MGLLHEVVCALPLFFLLSSLCRAVCLHCLPIYLLLHFTPIFWIHCLMPSLLFSKASYFLMSLIAVGLFILHGFLFFLASYSPCPLILLRHLLQLTSYSPQHLSIFLFSYVHSASSFSEPQLHSFLRVVHLFSTFPCLFFLAKA